MNKMFSDTMLVPAYVTRFSCIGGECEDTCCAGWGVTIDKESFLRYQSCLDPVLRPLVTKHVKRYSKSNSLENYGHIELRDDACRSCGFLSEAKLCLIQERLGEKGLSNTCASYPRTVHRIEDLHQMTLTLSCPEAARLALLQEDAFDLVGQWQTVSESFISTVKPKFGLSLAAMDDVRTLMFQILRSPDQSLSNRLKVIGVFCKRLTELLQKKQVDALPQLLLEMEKELESGAAMASLKGQTELPDVQAQIATSFFLAGWKSFQSPHSRKILIESATGLGIAEGVAPDASALVSAYEIGLGRLESALKEVPWLLEHYVFNEVLREYFPWGLENPMRHYKNLVLSFAITRLLLAGRSLVHDAPLTPAQLAETIQVCCRRYAHDTKFTTNLERVLTEQGWDSLERFHSLI